MRHVHVNPVRRHLPKEGKWSTPWNRHNGSGGDAWGSWELEGFKYVQNLQGQLHSKLLDSNLRLVHFKQHIDLAESSFDLISWANHSRHENTVSFVFIWCEPELGQQHPSCGWVQRAPSWGRKQCLSLVCFQLTVWPWAEALLTSLLGFSSWTLVNGGAVSDDSRRPKTGPSRNLLWI